MPRLRFDVEPRFEGYPQPSGRIIAYLGSEKVGFLDFWRTFDERASVQLEYLQVNPAFRGQRLGEAILRGFRKWLNQNFRWITHGHSEVISQRSLRTLNAAFGPALWLDNNIRALTFEEALEFLPVAVETDAHGGVAAEDTIRAVHWMKPRRPPNDEPLRQRYLAELAR